MPQRISTQANLLVTVCLSYKRTQTKTSCFTYFSLTTFFSKIAFHSLHQFRPQEHHHNQKNVSCPTVCSGQETVWWLQSYAFLASFAQERGNPVVGMTYKVHRLRSREFSVCQPLYEDGIMHKLCSTTWCAMSFTHLFLLKVPLLP